MGVVTERDTDRESDCGWERGDLNTDGKRFVARAVDIERDEDRETDCV